MTELETIPNGFRGYVVFRFQEPVPLTPGASYFISANRQGEQGVFWLSDFRLGYPRGTAYVGTAWPINDFWFQEGIVVPEPTTGALLLVGLGALGAARWFRREGQRGSYLV